jgi:hypothetical protein
VGGVNTVQKRIKYDEIMNTPPYKLSDEEVNIIINYNQILIDKLINEVNYIGSSGGDISQTMKKLEFKKRERTKFKRELNRRKKINNV